MTSLLIFGMRELQITKQMNIDNASLLKIQMTREKIQSQGANQKSIFSNTSNSRAVQNKAKAKFKSLAAEDKKLDLKQASIQQRLALEAAEIESDTKAREEAAKKAAPKFGLSA